MNDIKKCKLKKLHYIHRRALFTKATLNLVNPTSWLPGIDPRSIDGISSFLGMDHGPSPSIFQRPKVSFQHFGNSDPIQLFGKLSAVKYIMLVAIL